MSTSYGLKLLVVGLSAACGLVVEIVAGRMIAPYLGMSLYTWTAIISVVLAGFSIGHWIGGRVAEQPSGNALRLVAWSLLLAGASTVLSLILIRIIAPFVTSQNWDAVPTVLTVTFLLFFLPSLFVGIPSPVLTKLAVDDCSPRRTGRAIGAFFAVGAIGSIAGTLAAGFIFIAWLGSTRTLLLVAFVYVVLGLLLLLPSRANETGRFLRLVVVVLVSSGLLLFAGRKWEAFSEPCIVGSSYYCIRVIDVSTDYGQPARLMVLDHLGHGVNLRSEPQKLVSPYVELHDILARIHSGRRSPFRTFFIGGGAYTLPRAWAAARPDAEIWVAEIDPHVTKAAHARLWLEPSARIKTVFDDARTALRHTKPGAFDVIIGDAFHDIVIPPHLVTQEFFGLIASRLHDDGIYLMNVVDHRRQPRLALSIYRTMRKAMALQQGGSTIEIWSSNEPGARATFVLAALRDATPFGTLPSRVNPTVRFLRIPKAVIDQWLEAAPTMILSDDHAPISRLIGVE